MKVGIVGAGALGSLFGSFFEHEDVWLFEPLNTAHVDRIRSQGLLVHTPEGGTRRVRLNAVTCVDEIGRCDLLALFVKAPVTRCALESARPMIGEGTLLLSLQNGIGIAEILEDFVPREKLFRGVTSQGSTFLGPGEIRHAGVGKTRVGPLSSAGNETDRTAVAGLFQRSQIPFEMVDSVRHLVWEKLLINVGINALTAIFNVPNGELINDQDLQTIMRGAVCEAVMVARANGLDFRPERAVHEVEKICRLTAENISSMLQDVRRGSLTEIDYINGAIVREGERLGVETPLNCLLTRLIKEKVRIE